MARTSRKILDSAVDNWSGNGLGNQTAPGGQYPPLESATGKIRKDFRGVPLCV